MSLWRVRGVDSESGEDKSITVRAIDSDTASQYANDLGLYVKDVSPAAGSEVAEIANDDAGHREQVRLTSGERRTIYTLRGFTILLFITGILAILAGFQTNEPPYFSRSGYSHVSRFQDDNAYGATANATEYIAQYLDRAGHQNYGLSIVGAVLLLAGFVAIIPTEMIRSRATVRHFGCKL